jgi:hypothetical protein
MSLAYSHSGANTLMDEEVDDMHLMFLPNKEWQWYPVCWLVLFVCETDTTLNAIKRQLHHLKEPSLLSRVAFASAKHWTMGPESAPIELDDKTFSLKELCASDLPKAA